MHGSIFDQAVLQLNHNGHIYKISIYRVHRERLLRLLVSFQSSAISAKSAKCLEQRQYANFLSLQRHVCGALYR